MSVYLKLIFVGVLCLNSSPSLAQVKQPKPEADARLKGPAKPSSKVWMSGVAARVNREVITVADVWTAVGVGKLVSMNPAARKRVYEMTLRRLIFEKINDSAVAEMKFQLSEFDKRSFVEQRKESLGGEEAYREFLNEEGQTEQEFVQEFVNQYKRSYYLRSVGGAIGALSATVRPEHNIQPNPQQVRAFYKKNLETRFTVGKLARLRYLVITNRQAGSAEKAKQMVDSTRAALLTGADFATLARRVTKGTGKGVGDVVEIGGGGEDSLPVPEAVEEAAWDLPIGAISEPIKFRRGYYLVKVEQRLPERVRPFSEVQASILLELRNENIKRATIKVQRKLLKRSYIYPERYKRLLMQQ